MDLKSVDGTWHVSSKFNLEGDIGLPLSHIGINIHLPPSLLLHSDPITATLLPFASVSINQA